MRILTLSLLLFASTGSAEHTIESTKNGPWSNPTTWSEARLPRSGDRVLIRSGTQVSYDVASQEIIHSLRIAGSLTFADNRDTTLHVGTIRIQPTGIGEEQSDVADVHKNMKPASEREAVLQVGQPNRPIPAAHRARIVLHYFEDMDPENSPAIIARPGGRMELHGSPLARTWLKLAQPTKEGASQLTASGPLTGWNVGDRLLITGGEKKGRDDTPSEERIISRIDGQQLHFDQPLENSHAGGPIYASEVANLSRNVIIESADPDGVRGHTMYHRYSKGSISYAAFSHLGKQGVLGRYPIHFHLAGDTLRGSSVVGAVITDSHNRWLTIHGTHYLLVRDCIGYQSLGHGFFLEDATEVYNILDRNLAVQAYATKRLPDQALPFDPNDGAGFWWANGKNTFIRNVSCENEEYGYRYDIQKRSNYDSHQAIRQSDGTEKVTDIRTIPIWRFENNEAHTENLYGMVVAANGGSQPDTPVRTEKFLNQLRDMDWTGPDRQHPHHIKDLKIWESHYAFRPHSPNMWMEDVHIHKTTYGIYRPAFDGHVYRNLHLSQLGSEPFNRGMDDASAQNGSISVDGLTLVNMPNSSQVHPIVHMTDLDLKGDAECHFRGVDIRDCDPRRPVFNRGGSTRVDPFIGNGVPYFLHDYFGPGRHAKLVSTKSDEYRTDGHSYREEPPLTGDESRVAEVTGVDFPRLLDPVDDEAPASAITWPRDGDAVALKGGMLVIRGTATDNVDVASVRVNGVEAKSVDFQFHQWEAVLEGVEPGALTLEAVARDVSGLTEQTGHRIRLRVR